MGLGKGATLLGKRFSARIINFASRNRASSHGSGTHSIASAVSDLGTSQSLQPLEESNALNHEGLHIIKQISREIEHRVEENEDCKIPIDHFCGEDIPAISIEGFLARMARYINIWRSHPGGRESAGVRAAVITTLYLNHIDRLNPEYPISMHNIHRLLIAGMLVATKWTEDRGVSTEWWSRVAGISMSEVNKLEAKFCHLLQFELFIDEIKYLETLETFCEYLDFDSSASCSDEDSC